MTLLTRRHSLVLGLSALAQTSLLPPAFGMQDRPQVNTSGWLMFKKLHCANRGVPVSLTDGRLARPEDFGGAGCTVLEESIEGPYFTCIGTSGGKQIADARSGVPLTVALRVQDAACVPVAGAAVDIWHCDARGQYSGYLASPDEDAPAWSHIAPETGERFCRGVLATDVDGIVEFDTIYPGYYKGRAIHVHFKVHIGDRAFLTSQALLPEDRNTHIMGLDPYSAPRQSRRVFNSEESDWGLASFSIIQRDGRMLATLPVTLDSQVK